MNYKSVLLKMFETTKKQKKTKTTVSLRSLREKKPWHASRGIIFHAKTAKKKLRKDRKGVVVLEWYIF